MSVFLSLAPAWLDTVFYIYWFVLIIMLIMDDREPSITLAWLFILLFLPFIGVFFYIFFGRDWKVVARRHGWVQRLRETEIAEMAPIYERNAQAVARFYEEWGDSIAEPISRAISKENVARVLPASSLELYNDGAHKFRRLKEDLAAAQRFIHLQYFIWEQDRLTAELVPILLDRLAAGVEVRIMYDWMGCICVQQGRAQAAQAGGRAGRGRRHRPAAHQLPQPPQDRRHRRRDRLHRRHERRPGVHRRRRPLRHLARHPPAPDRPGGRRAGEALRGALVRAQEEGRRRRPLRRRVHAGARPGRRGDGHARRGGRAGGRRPLERGPPHPHGRHRAGRGVRLDPVAVLHPRLQHLRRDDQRRPQRGRRAVHDDRHPGQAHRPVGGADVLPQAHRGRARASSSTRPGSCTPRRSSSTAP